MQTHDDTGRRSAATRRTSWPLSAMDRALLAVERPPVTMNIGSLLVFEPFDATTDEIAAHVGRRLDRAPQLRRRLVPGRSGFGRAVWADDDRFDVRAHVHRVGLGRGSPDDDVESSLLELFATLQSIPLDRSRPLWELWVVDLPDGRNATVQKIHHSLADGMSDIGILLAVLDPTPDVGPPDADGTAVAPGPAPVPARTRLLIDVVRHPVAAAGAAFGGLRALAATAGALARPAPASSLSRPIGSQRRFAVVRHPLGPVRDLARRHATTVNDVVTAATGVGLGALLRRRGDAVDGLRLQVVVPVSVRRHDGAGNAFVPVRIGLPVDDRDPLDVLFTVHRQMSHAKRSAALAGAMPLLRAAELVPSAVVDTAVHRIVGRQRVMNVMITDIPGPQFPLWFMGRRLLEGFPYVPLLQHTSVGVAIASYDGALTFGLTADRDVASDVAVLADGIGAALDALCTR